MKKSNDLKLKILINKLETELKNGNMIAVDTLKCEISKLLIKKFSI